MPTKSGTQALQSAWRPLVQQLISTSGSSVSVSANRADQANFLF